jgi:hypothetical protein
MTEQEASGAKARTSGGSQADAQPGVDFPVAADGRRSTSAFGRAVIADALRKTDPAGALGAEQETNWRSGYLTHFRRVIEAGLSSRHAALGIAADGLASLRSRMRSVRPGGDEADLDDLLGQDADRDLRTATVTGVAESETELALPYRGDWLRGDDLVRRLDAWVAAGIIEPSCADAVREVAAHPEWLPLPGRTVAVLGAGSEVGPLPVLLRWGATVAGIDLPQPRIWERVLANARSSAGTLLVPVAADPGSGGKEEAGAGELAGTAGADLTSEVAGIADWLSGLNGPLVLGNYVYADGAANVRVCAAADTLTLRLQGARDDVALAFLATPTDVFAVPGEAVEHSAKAYQNRPAVLKVAGRPLRALSGGRLMRRAYQPGSDPGTTWSPSKARTTRLPSACNGGG